MEEESLLFNPRSKAAKYCESGDELRIPTSGQSSLRRVFIIIIRDRVEEPEAKGAGEPQFVAQNLSGGISSNGLRRLSG